MTNEKECVKKEEYCDCRMEDKMGLYIEYENLPIMFRAAAVLLEKSHEGNVYVLFRGMGSVILDISNPRNVLEIARDYVEMYNDENGETTIIKIDEITGFVFEQPRTTEEVVE